MSKASALHDMLSDELLMKVFEWVPPTDLLGSVSIVCKRLDALINDNNGAFWRCHSLIHGDHWTAATRERLTVHQIQRCCIWQAAVVAQQNVESAATATPPLCLKHGSVLVSRRVAKELRVAEQKRTCAASTTHHVNEHVENVLPESDEGREKHVWFTLIGSQWWSSSPSPTRDSNEVLLFASRYPEALLTKVLIKPLVDPFHRAHSYTWKQTVIRAYRFPVVTAGVGACASSDTTTTSPTFIAGSPCSFRPGQEEQTDHHPQQQQQQQQRGFVHDQHVPQAPSDQGIIDGLLAGQAPVYESEPYDVPRHVGTRRPVGEPDTDDGTLTYFLPAGVVANCITITLMGKYNEQFAGSGEFYACVEKVDCLGIPLYPHPPSVVRVLPETFVKKRRKKPVQSAVGQVGQWWKGR